MQNVVHNTRRVLVYMMGILVAWKEQLWVKKKKNYPQLPSTCPVKSVPADTGRSPGIRGDIPLIPPQSQPTSNAPSSILSIIPVRDCRCREHSPLFFLRDGNPTTPVQELWNSPWYLLLRDSWLLPGLSSIQCDSHSAAVGLAGNYRE